MILNVLAELVAQQTATITVEIAAVPGASDAVVAEWARLGKRALVPRCGAC
jgi:hypothetical protein